MAKSIKQKLAEDPAEDSSAAAAQSVRPSAAAELSDAVEVKLRQTCGALEVGATLGRVVLRKGVSVDFLVDALRSNIAVASPAEGEPQR